MEVHAHSHTPRKKWTHYLWEFLMLFLAVVCGFLAENQREHYVEHNREKQYLRSLHRDLKSDTTFNNFFKGHLDRVHARLGMIVRMITNRQYKNNADSFYLSVISSRQIRFYEYHNSTFEQLKNSGNLRLLRNIALVDSLTEYNNAVQERLNNQETRYKLATANLSTALWGILDAGYFKENTTRLNNGAPTDFVLDNPVIEKIDEQKLLLYKNLVFERQLMIPSFWLMVDNANNKATNLLLLLKEKYHLE